MGSLGPGAHKVLFEPPSVSGRYGVLILNVLSPFLPFYWGFSFGIQHSPVDGCSAASCNFGVLAGEDECTCFYSTILSCGENTPVIANSLFQQHKRGLYTWTSPEVQYRNQIDYIIYSQRWRSSIQSAKTRSGTDCGSDHDLLIAKIKLKLKEVWKISRPFRYDLNQIPYDYTVEVRNRFKGLDLIECLMSYGPSFEILYRRQGSRPSPWKRNAKKQNGCLGRPYK